MQTETPPPHTHLVSPAWPTSGFWFQTPALPPARGDIPKHQPTHARHLLKDLWCPLVAPRTQSQYVDKVLRVLSELTPEAFAALALPSRCCKGPNPGAPLTGARGLLLAPHVPHLSKMMAYPTTPFFPCPISLLTLASCFSKWRSFQEPLLRPPHHGAGRGENSTESHSRREWRRSALTQVEAPVGAPGDATRRKTAPTCSSAQSSEGATTNN